MATRKMSFYHNISLVFFNIFFIALAIVTSISYSKIVGDNQKENSLKEFYANVESMKKVSTNYLDSENGYVLNWANYITNAHMTLEEALDFLRVINTNTNRFAHIVDMETFDGYSSSFDKGHEGIKTYKKYGKTDLSTNEKDFLNTMRQMYDDNSTKFYVLGRYLITETLKQSISLGKRITLYDNGVAKGYLLLRVIPVSEVQKSWVFPISYTNHNAEVGIIKTDGSYVIESDSMKSSNFLEYLRAYNFYADYDKKEELYNELLNNKTGVLYYKNFRDKDCVWYYSRLSDGLNLDIVGVVSAELFDVDNTRNWFIVITICGTLILLVIVDGIYLGYINKRLKFTAEAQRSANVAKTKFLSSMSHDIRTPLNAVLGLNRLALRNVDDKEYVKDCLEKSSVAGKQLLTLVNDVLDISKIESGKLTINPAVVNLKILFNEILEIVSPDANLKNISLVFDLSSLTDTYVMTDKLRLEQISLNLLSNAIKYTEANGRVEFSVLETVNSDKVNLVITVKDNGIGMSEEFQKSMYESFEREDSLEVSKTQGTGLGLYIVKHTVDSMGGLITCKSSPGGGTEFKVSLDLDVAKNKEEISVKENTDFSSLKNINVLVAEDNMLNGRIIKALLKNYGINCDLVLNGSLCCDKLFENNENYYTCILMDVHMPIMSGLDVTRKIRSEGIGRRKNIPIVALTADVFEENVNECLAAGMNYHITKPIDEKKLLTILHEIERRG